MKSKDTPMRRWRKERAALREARGIVSVWANAKLDPNGMDGKGGPVGEFDHDRRERGSGAGLSFSYSSSFAEDVRRRLGELGLSDEAIQDFDLLYDCELDAPPGRRAYGWFLGSFPYTKGAPAAKATAKSKGKAQRPPKRKSKVRKASKKPAKVKQRSGRRFGKLIGLPVPDDDFVVAPGFVAVWLNTDAEFDLTSVPDQVKRIFPTHDPISFEPRTIAELDTFTSATLFVEEVRECIRQSGVAPEAIRFVNAFHGAYIDAKPGPRRYGHFLGTFRTLLRNTTVFARVRSAEQNDEWIEVRQKSPPLWKAARVDDEWLWSLGTLVDGTRKERQRSRPRTDLAECLADVSAALTGYRLLADSVEISFEPEAPLARSDDQSFRERLTEQLSAAVQ